MLGVVYFRQERYDEPVHVSISIDGLSDGYHGIHIHNKGVNDLSCVSANCCDLLGGHFTLGNAWSPTNPAGIKHGSLVNKTTRHTGDMCNNIYSLNYHAQYEYVDELISLQEGDPAFIIGRSVVIHMDRDDEGETSKYTDEKRKEESMITGNSGTRIACAQIEYDPMNIYNV